MPPKSKISKEEIILSAIEMIRESGMQSINARALAAKLGTSTQPIFSNFSSMDALLFAVLDRANDIFESFRKKELESGKYPAYKASGMAYIRFAKEEKELFSLLYMRNRENESLYKEAHLNDEMESEVQKNTGIEKEKAKLFHLEMWAFVHGIASMLTTGFVELEFDLVSHMLTDAYLGLKKQYEEVDLDGSH